MKHQQAYGLIYKAWWCAIASPSVALGVLAVSPFSSDSSQVVNELISMLLILLVASLFGSLPYLLLVCLAIWFHDLSDKSTGIKHHHIQGIHWGLSLLIIVILFLLFPKNDLIPVLALIMLVYASVSSAWIFIFNIPLSRALARSQSMHLQMFKS